VGISCISVTAKREELVDFTHSFDETYTAIAVRQTTVLNAVKEFFSRPEVLMVLAAVLLAATIIGGIFYLLEHKSNKKLFAHHTLLGRIIEPAIIGLMFVSNGPIRHYRFKTLTARTLATVLALGSTIMIAAMTAILASSFTLDVMQAEVRSLEDLRRLEVAALEASTSSAFLREYGIVHQTRSELDALLRDLDSGELDAIVADAAFLTYRINKGRQMGEFKNLVVLPDELAAQNYAFVLDQDSPLRESINRALLTVRIQRAWQEKLREYFGE
jgi:polar amino acid transport system substrate-binding protein